MFTYKYIGRFDVSGLKAEILRLDESAWLEHRERQLRAPPHAKTHTLEVLWHWDSLLSGEVGRKHPNYDKLHFESLLKDIYPIYRSFYGDGMFLRVLLTRLQANANIEEHADSGSSLSQCHRTHIPLITNPNVLFYVGGECKHMEEGEIWEIDNTNLHSVVNRSDLARVHLIIDYAPGPSV